MICMVFMYICLRQSQTSELTCPSREKRAELDVKHNMLNFFNCDTGMISPRRRKTVNAFYKCFYIVLAREQRSQPQGKMTCVNDFAEIPT